MINILKPFKTQEDKIDEMYRDLISKSEAIAKQIKDLRTELKQLTDRTNGS